MNIPEIGDYTIKKQKRDKFTPTPDNILLNEKNNKNNKEVDTGMMSSLNDVGMARSSLLSLKLDKE